MGHDAAAVREAACMMRAMTVVRSTAVPVDAMRATALKLSSELPGVLRAKDRARLGPDAALLLEAFPEVARLEAAAALFRAGLSDPLVRRALDLWQDDAPHRVARDPYGCVFEVGGTLDVADEVAGPDDPDRLAHHVAWILRVAKREGHTMLPLATVLSTLDPRKRGEDILAVGEAAEGLAGAEDAFRRAAARGAFVVLPGRQALMLPDLSELLIVREVRARAAAGCLAVPDDLGTDLTAEQRRAVDVVASASLSILTGGPGTGKSTVIRALVEALGERRCLITAPTGRAARNVGGSTVHSASGGRLLTRRPLQETSKADVPPDLALLVVDEASMLTTELMAGVLNLAPRTAHIVLVGDADQLPPVGAGNVLKDLLACGDRVPSVRLTYNHRSATAVQRVANDVLEGRVPAGGELVLASTAAEGLAAVVRLCAAAPAPQVLVPHNAHRRQLNRALQSTLRDVPVRLTSRGVRGLLRTSGDAAARITLLGDEVLEVPIDRALAMTEPVDPYLPGDSVMVLKNQNKKRLRPGEVSACNGDVGVLARARPRAVVSFGGDATAEFPSPEWLTLAYAATVHKFQGSECEAVVLPIYAASAWDRGLLYTAVTRAKSRVVFVGTTRHLESIVTRTRPGRHSALHLLLGV